MIYSLKYPPRGNFRRYSIFSKLFMRQRKYNWEKLNFSMVDCKSCGCPLHLYKSAFTLQNSLSYEMLSFVFQMELLESLNCAPIWNYCQQNKLRNSKLDLSLIRLFKWIMYTSNYQVVIFSHLSSVDFSLKFWLAFLVTCYSKKTVRALS